MIHDRHPALASVDDPGRCTHSLLGSHATQSIGNQHWHREDHRWEALRQAILTHRPPAPFRGGMLEQEPPAAIAANSARPRARVILFHAAPSLRSSRFPRVEKVRAPFSPTAVLDRNEPS
nr:hypothetical protein CFP56_36310 [Quercus suber]